MIKFFRRIRQNLLAEGKTGKYLKYAIGEIVLVVIGILIALQINNWNERNKESRLENTYIQNVKKDLEAQLSSVENQLVYEQSFIASSQVIIDYLNRNKQPDEAFHTTLTNLAIRNTFAVNDATFTDLISSGNINLISNESIRNKIISYYQELERTEKIVFNNNIEFVDGNFVPLIQRLGFYQFTEESILFKVYLENNPAFESLNLYENSLAEASALLITEPRNKLSLMNGVKQRLIIAMGHTKLMENTKQKTEELIRTLGK